MSGSSEGNSRNRLLALLAAFSLAWFCNLGYRQLVKPDEGRYAEIPREMVASGDWLTPRLNGYKYFEKPALQYWATAVSFSVFGQNEWAARLWPGMAGLLGGKAPVRAAGRAVRRGGDSGMRPLRRCRPYPDPGHGPDFFHVGVGIRVRRRAAGRRGKRATPLDARRLGVRGARRHDQGTGRDRAPRGRG